MQNHMGWMMGTLAATAALAALGVGLNGYRNSPPPRVRPAQILANPANPQDRDPLAPRLFDQDAPLRVHLAGAVRKPGVYSLPSWARVVDAMKKAGGPTPNADLNAINLADHIRDGEQIRIPTRGRHAPLAAHYPTPEPPALPASTGGRGTGRYPFAPGATGAPLADALVNLNTADRAALDRLPGIGPATADRIIAYRQEHGLFNRPEDLMNVTGIGEAKFDKLRSLVTAP